MTIFVAVVRHKGVTQNVVAYLTRESAEKDESEWLEEYGIQDQQTRDEHEADGTVFMLSECDLRP